ncbi:MAG: DUF4870 domain-containing protein [Christiangramia sp.]|uniref:DUF4870 domain-containing protein n=1 Tax=Christiangramia sp. TaxID=1931228 RepID=UPI003241CFDC
MTTQIINQNKTLAAVLHLSVFTKYFFPLGNFLFPMLLWLAKKQDPFVDQHGRNALNFQISTFLYTVFLLAVGAATFFYFGVSMTMDHLWIFHDHHFEVDSFSDALPFFIIIVVLGLLLLGLFVLEIFAVIMAAMNASDGKPYKYPLSINFLGSSSISVDHTKEETA